MRGLISFYRKRIFRIAEFLVIFVIVPILLFTKVIDISFMPVLAIGALIFLIQLIRDPSFRRKRLWNWNKARKSIGTIFLYFIPVALLMTLSFISGNRNTFFICRESTRYYGWACLSSTRFFPLFRKISHSGHFLFTVTGISSRGTPQLSWPVPQCSLLGTLYSITGWLLSSPSLVAYYSPNATSKQNHWSPALLSIRFTELGFSPAD
nr:hypothetical protein [Prolixibacter bellariivorans]